MAKSTVLSKAIAVGILVILTVGLGIFLVPRIAAVFDGKQIDWTPSLSLTEEPLSPFEEQALLQQAYANTLEEDIVTSLERLTGTGTVQATVRAELDLRNGTLNNKKHHMWYREQYLSGTVQHLSVSVLIDGQTVSDKAGRAIYQPRSRADMTRYTDLVRTIVGFDAERGDQLEVLNLPFTGPKAVWFGVSSRVWGNILSVILVSGLFLILILVIIIPFMRAIVRSTHQPIRHVDHTLYRQVERLCRQSPERAAQTVRRLLSQTHDSKSNRNYSPAAQAVMVVMTLDRSLGRRILSYLTAAEIKKLGQVGSRLGSVPARDIRLAMETFIHGFDVPAHLQGTASDVKSFLVETRPDGEHLFSEMKLTESGQSLWKRIAGLDIGTLVGFLKRQRPEAAALVLCHLPETLSGQLLTLLPTESSSRILIHLTHLKRIKPGLREKMTGEIAQAIYNLIHRPEDFGGPEKVASIIRTMSAKQKNRLMTQMATAEESTVSEMQAYLWDWSDLVKLSDEAIQKLLVYCEKDTLAAALSNRPAEEQALFARNMTPALWQEIRTLTAQSDKLATGNEARSIIIRTAREIGLFKS